MIKDNKENKAPILEEDEQIYYDQFCECQDYVIEECLEILQFNQLQKILPIASLTKFNQVLLQNIVKQINQQLQIRLKVHFIIILYLQEIEYEKQKKLNTVSEKYYMKEQLVKIQAIKQEQQILSSLGFTENIVQQDENQVFFEVLLKNMKFLSKEAQNKLNVQNPNSKANQLNLQQSNLISNQTQIHLK